MSNYLKGSIEEQEATSLMNQHLQSSWWKRIASSKTLVSIEPTYIPVWSFAYQASSHTVSEGMEGKITIEPISRMSAILPVECDVHQGEVSQRPVLQDVSMEEAQKVIYWEMFAKEKRREKINVQMLDKQLLYLPYWVGYTKDKRGVFDVVVLDALNGKIDIPMKETVMQYVWKEAHSV
ncbi:hypothetical protein [Halobacillus salinus]|uniref:hypothetical protein n=1 Tax=Halobacillus salinus TaxID=192814 RepID=UPI0009A61333|nr:hypothetical protein [Halobacillus salinus]